jgi:fibronectin-binding autotransporter adhesin
MGGKQEWRAWWRRLAGKSELQGEQARRRALRRLQVESLEGRALLASITWTGAASTDWSNTANWSPAQIPNAADEVTINDVANDPTLDSARSVGSLTGNGIINLNAQTLTVGALNTSTSFTGQLNGVGGSVTKTGSGVFTISGGGVASNSATGALTVDGGQVTLGAGFAGDGGWRGNVTVNNSATFRLAQGDILINSSLVTVNGGGVFHTGGFADSIGALSGSGSVQGGNTLTIDMVAGTTQTFTGSITSTSISARGENDNGTGSRQVLAGTWSGGSLGVSRGNSANDVVVLELGGTGTSSVSFVGLGNGGSGTATLNIADTHALTSTGNFFLGENTGHGATVNQSGGSVTVQGEMRIAHWGSATSAYNLSNGSLSVPTGTVIVGWDGIGSLNISGGTANIQNLRVGKAAGSVLNMTGGTLNIANSFGVGEDPTDSGTVNHSAGTINFNGTGTGDSTGFRIGHWPSQTSVYNLSGTGVLNSPNAEMTLGWDGNGSFLQTGGTASVRGIRVTRGAGRTGTLNLSGGTLNVGSSGIYSGGGTANISLGGAGGILAASANWNSSLPMTLNGTGASGVSIDTNGNSVGLSGILGGAGSLTKIDAGTLTLSNFNTYTGGTTVDGGVLMLGAGGATGAIRGTLTVNTGATVNHSTDNTFGYVGGQSVNVLNINGGTVGGANFGNHFWNNFQLNMTGGTLHLGGTLNEFQNPTITVNSSATTAQILPVTGNAVLRLRDNTSATVNVADGASTDDLIIQVPVTQSGTSNVTKTSAGRMALTAASNTFNFLAVAGGAVQLGTAGSTNTLPGGIRVGDAFVAGGGSATLDIPDGTLTTGWIELGNTPGTAITATVNQTGGSVRTTGQAAENAGLRLGHFPAATTFYNLSSGTLLVDNGFFLTAAVDGTGTFNQTGGTATATRVVVNARGGSGGNGTVTVSGGTLNVGSGGIVNDGTGPAAVNVGGSGGTIRATAPFSSALGMTLSGTGANAAKVDTNGNAATLSGVLGGTGALQKEGNGTLSLTNFNTYTGGTTVNGGTLLLGAGGATGTIRGALTVNTGATIDYSTDNAFGYNGGQSVNVLNINGGTVGGANFGNHFWNNFQLNMTGGTLRLGGTLNEFQNPTITVNSSATTAQILPVTGNAVLRLRDNTSATVNVADGASTDDLLINVPITQNGTSNIFKVGAGRMAITGTTNTFNYLDIAAGPATLGAAGTTTTLGSGIQVGDAFVSGGGSAELDIPDGTLSAAWIQLGNTPGAAITATVNQTGGTVRTTGQAAENAGVRLGHFPAATTFYNMSNGTLLVDNGFFLTAAVDGTGTFNQTGGTATATRVVVNARGGSGGNGTVTVAGGTLNVGSGGIVNDGSGPAAVNVGGSGGTIRATAPFNSSLGMTLAGTGANAAKFDTNGNAVTLSGVLGGAGALQKEGNGTLSLTNFNTYTGGTTVNGGTLLLGAGGATGTIRGSLTVNTGATVDYSTDNTFGYNGGQSVNVLNINGGTVGGANFGNHFWNNFQLNMTGGTLNLGGTLNEFHNPTITVNSSAATAQILPVTGSAVLRLRDGTSATVNVADGAATNDLVINVPITQNTTSNVSKVGAGRMALTAASNTFNFLGVAGGAVQLGTAGSTNTLPGGIRVGDAFVAGGGSATLDIPDGTLTTGWIELGNTPGTTITATVNQTGGSVRTTGQAAENAGVRLGHFPAATTFYNLSSGTLLVDNGFFLTAAVDGTGTFNQTGGTATATRVVVNARGGSGGNGTVTVSGGTLNVGSGGIVNDGTGPAAMNVGGSGGTIRATAPFGSSLPMTLAGAGVNAATFDTNGNAVTLSGALTGSGGLNKNGAATLTLSGAGHAYVGATTVNAGTLRFHNVSNVFASPIANNSAVETYLDNSGYMRITGAASGAGTWLIDGSGAGNQWQNRVGLMNATSTATGRIDIAPNGRLWEEKFTGQGSNIGPSQSINLQAASSRFYVYGNAGESIAIGSLQGSGVVDFYDGGSGNNLTLSLGGDNSNQTFSGQITNSGLSSGPTTLNLVKIGSGVQSLNGTNTYSGTTTVSGGRLNVNGSITSPVTVSAAGTLGGTGNVLGTVASAGVIAPGNSPGILSTGNVTLTGGSLAIEIGGPNAGNTASDHDQLDVTGSVSLGNGVAQLLLSGAYVPSVGDDFVIIDNDGAADFTTGYLLDASNNPLYEGAPITFNGRTLFLSYNGGDGNDVVLNTAAIVNGTDAADSILITPMPGGALQYVLNGAPTVTLPGPLASFTFNGQGGDDLMTVQLNANPLPAGGLALNGEEQTTPPGAGANGVYGDTLRVIGTLTQTATYLPNGVVNPLLDNDGTVTIAGQGDDPVHRLGASRLAESRGGESAFSQRRRPVEYRNRLGCRHEFTRRTGRQRNQRRRRVRTSSPARQLASRHQHGHRRLGRRRLDRLPKCQQFARQLGTVDRHGRQRRLTRLLPLGRSAGGLVDVARRERWVCGHGESTDSAHDLQQYRLADRLGRGWSGARERR